MKSDTTLNCGHTENPNEALNPSNELQLLTELTGIVLACGSRAV